MENADLERQLLRSSDYARPRNTQIDKLIDRMLGPVPEGLVLVMSDKTTKLARNIRPLAYLTMLAALVLMFSLAFENPFLAASPFMLLVEWISPLGFWVTVIVAFVVWFEILRAMIRSVSKSSRTDSVVGSSGLYELECADAELQLRSGAENWSIARRINSVLIGGLTYSSIWLTFFLPLSSAIALTLVNVIYMFMYLAQRESTGSSMLATVTVTKFRSSFGRFFYLYYIAAIVALTFGAGMLDGLAAMLQNQF